MIRNGLILANLQRPASWLQAFSCRNASVDVHELQLKQHGDPQTALQLKISNIDEKIALKESELWVKLVAAPINPADINIVQGNYAITPKELPATVGMEGLYEVVRAGSGVGQFKPGDWVIPNYQGWGTWRTHAIAPQNMFIKIPNNLDKRTCATIQVNPSTAFRMLMDFVQLKEGDTVIQNGANSGVGQSVIQIGKALKLNVVNIVRKRDNQSILNGYLESLGAKYIFTEDELRKQVLAEDLWKTIPKPRLGLNCVGGKATSDLVRLLDHEATLVTYGGMSRQPLTLNTADFIFKDLKCSGFWMTRWRKKHPEEYTHMLKTLLDMVATKQLKAPECVEFKMVDYREAFKHATTAFTTKKTLLVA